MSILIYIHYSTLSGLTSHKGERPTCKQIITVIVLRAFDLFIHPTDTLNIYCVLSP